MKWVIGVVAVLVVVCGCLCASGGLFWYAQQSVALPDAFPVEPAQVEPVPAPPPIEPPPAAPPPVEPPAVAPPATPPAAPPPVAPAPTPSPTTSSTSSSSSSSSKSSTSASSSSSTTKAPESSKTTSTKTSTTKTTAPAPAPASTSSTSSSSSASSSKSTAEEADVVLPAADETVAVGFVLPSGAKWEDLKVSVDGKSLGRRPLRTRVTPGMHSFSFRGEEIDITCSIEVGTSGRTIIIDQKKKSCPGKGS